MLRVLLEDRFSLASHRETREHPGYSLVTSRSDKRLGPGLVRSGFDRAKWILEGRPNDSPGPPSRAAPHLRQFRCQLIANGGVITGLAISMAQLAKALEANLQAPVIDRTGLSGVFDVDLKYTPGSDLTGTSSDAVSIFTAVREELGLTLERGRASIDVLVIDSIKRPTPD